MESPEFVRLIGKGKFSFEDSILESRFELYRNPYETNLLVEEKALCTAVSKLFSESITVQLSGTLDDGRPINASALHLTKTRPSGNSLSVEFTAFEGVFLGPKIDTPPAESKYPLTGYFDGELALVYDGWDINTIPCPSPKAAKALAEKWRCPVEGMMLQLRREGSTIEQHRDFARVLMTLLSLASGTGVSCDRHFFTWGNQELEIWSPWTGDEIGPGSIVPAFETGRFLEQALPAWQRLSQEQQSVFRLALHHINLSALGYLDTRLFHIVQPWEFLANAWEVHGVLSDSVTCLLSRLQLARKQWNKDHPNSDPHGFWGSRISSIFEWPKLRDAVERLAASFGLDLKGMGLDLDMLKEARDSVAHSGRLSNSLIGHKRETVVLLMMGQHCLQLLLLRMLEYHGRVYHAANGWRTIVDIDQALTTART